MTILLFLEICGDELFFNDDSVLYVMDENVFVAFTEFRFTILVFEWIFILFINTI